MTGRATTTRMDPRRVADLALAAAVRARAEAVYLEPALAASDAYVITFERAREVLASVPLPAHLGAAVIARLAFVAELDLAAAHASSGVVSVRAGDRSAEVIVTVRPGTSPRADLTVIDGQRQIALGEPLALSPGDSIGQYRVLEVLGEGGMGSVYRVEQVSAGRQYALKVLRDRVVDRERTTVERFLLEARTAARVRHPGIVEVFDLGCSRDGRPYFVMELLEGQSLADLVARGALAPPVVVSVIRQLAAALAAAHDRGVIHADVTPSNVLVIGGAELRVKLVDFGLAQLAGRVLDDDEPARVVGTPAYISPEQLHGLAATDRSDQYGLGAVAYELLAGHPPFHHADLRTLCRMHLEAPIPPLESPHGPLSPRLADLVTTCLQKPPHARFPSMRAVLAELDEIERAERGGRQGISS